MLKTEAYLAAAELLLMLLLLLLIQIAKDRARVRARSRSRGASKLAKLSILPRSHERERADRADQTHEHVFLRVPNVALGSQKFRRRRAADQRAPPFNEFVSHADCHADRDDEKRLPAFTIENVEPNKKFARDHRRDKSRREMAEPIVVIATPMKIIAEPIEDRFVRVSPVSADAQDRDVNRDQRVDERGELESPISRGENDHADDSGKKFEPPSDAVVRTNSRPNENDRDGDQECDVRFLHFVVFLSLMLLILLSMFGAGARVRA